MRARRASAHVAESQAGESQLECWRRVLLGSVAAGALALYGARPARAQIIPPAPPCNNVTAGVVTCTGDVSPGVEAVNYVGVNVYNLTADIRPSPGVEGIALGQLRNNIVVNSDTGTFSIVTTGATADAIFAGSGVPLLDGGNVQVNSIGHIIAGRRGIYARSVGALTGDVTVNSTGDIVSGAAGIHAESATGHVRVDSDGDIDSGTRAIYASSTFGGVDVYSQGRLKATGDGIYARSSGIVSGSVRVENSSSIGAGGRGIHAQSASASVTVENFAEIHADSDGIYATTGSSTATVRNSGDRVWRPRHLRQIADRQRRPDTKHGHYRRVE